VRRSEQLVLTTIAALALLVVPLEGRSAEVQTRPLCFGKPATIVGSQRTDGIIGTPGADVIVSFGGSDSILALGGNDRVCSGPGNDEIEADAYVSNPGTADMSDGGPGVDICRDAERTVNCEETRLDLPHDGDVAPGTYVSETFRPRVGLTLGRGWTIPFTTLPTQLLLTQRPDPGGLNMRFDSQSRQSVAATVARLTKVRGLRANAVGAVRVGGAAGRSLDLRVTGRSVVLPGLTEAYALEPGDRVRAYVVSVQGTTVSIFVEAPARDFAKFSAIARRVLASVRWG
jgi:RTX calcium-binding nonapeptide repeat (4 copies)